MTRTGNLQGDVSAIIDANGQVVARYVYDAWGNLLSYSGELARVNPVTYRGYYFDWETGLFYLQSRYYCPVLRRFISADVYMDTGVGILGTNVYIYCNNDPVNYYDPNGYFPISNATRNAIESAGFDVANMLSFILRNVGRIAPNWVNLGYHGGTHLSGERIQGPLWLRDFELNITAHGEGYIVGTISFNSHHPNRHHIDFVAGAARAVADFGGNLMNHELRGSEGSTGWFSVLGMLASEIPIAGSVHTLVSRSLTISSLAPTRSLGAHIWNNTIQTAQRAPDRMVFVMIGKRHGGTRWPTRWHWTQ